MRMYTRETLHASVATEIAQIVDVFGCSQHPLLLKAANQSLWHDLLYGNIATGVTCMYVSLHQYVVSSQLDAQLD